MAATSRKKKPRRSHRALGMQGHPGAATTGSLLWVKAEQVGHQDLPAVAQAAGKHCPWARIGNRVTHGTFSIWESGAGGFAWDWSQVLHLQTHPPHLQRAFSSLRIILFFFLMHVEVAQRFPELLKTSGSILGRKSHFSHCLCSSTPHKRRAPGWGSFRIFGASQKPFNYL